MNGKRQNGSVLLLTLFLMTIISALALHLGYYQSRQVRLVNVHKKNVVSGFIVRGLMQSVIEKLEKDKTENEFDHPKETWWSAYRLGKEARGLSLRELDRSLKGDFYVVISDEAGKMNVNTTDLQKLKTFFENFEGVDGDKLSTDILAYREAKGRLKKFLTVHELLRVSRMAPEQFLGEDLNENGMLEKEEDDGNGELELGLKDFFTVFNDGKINLNTVSFEVLLSMPGINEDLARTIIDTRDQKAFESIEEVLNIPLISPKDFEFIKQWADVKSDWYTVAVTVRVDKDDRDRHLVAVVDRRELPAKIRYWRED